MDVVNHPERDQDWDSRERGGETEVQRLDRNWLSLLQELRVVQTGVQLLTGFLLTRRMHQALGARASVLMGLTWFGSIALIDRSAGAGIDLIVGLCTIAALDRIISEGAASGDYPFRTLSAVARNGCGRVG